MPSLRRDRPLMVNKGTQCTLLSYTQNNLQSTISNSFGALHFDDCEIPQNKDYYHTNIHGNVTSLSMGPTIIYKLDPEATREVLLGNPGIINRFDLLSCIPPSDCNLSDSCNKHMSQDDLEIDSNIDNDIKDGEENSVGKLGLTSKNSSNVGSKRKKRKCHGPTLIIYPRWWSCRQLFNQSSNGSTSPDTMKSDEIPNIKQI